MTHRINFLDKYYIVGIDSCGLETLRGFGFVPHVKALNINWCARLQQLAQLTPCVLGIARLAPLDTTWCTASGSPIEPEGLPCTSYWVLLFTRLLIMDSVLSSLETLVVVLCACQ